MYYIDFVDDHFVVVCCFDMTISDYRKFPLSNLRSAAGTEYTYCADSFRDFIAANKLVKRLNTFYVKHLENVDNKAPELYSHFTIRKCSECGKYYIVLYENRYSELHEPMCQFCFGHKYDESFVPEFYGLYYVRYDSEEEKFVVAYDAKKSDTYEDTFNLSNLCEKIRLPEGMTDIKYSRNPNEINTTVSNLNDYLIPNFTKGFLYDHNFIVRQCRDCGKYFMVTKYENDKIVDKGWSLPVRCGKCRRGVREEESVF